MPNSTDHVTRLLEDDVVRLRALEPEDLGLLYTIENDPALWVVGNGGGPYSRYALKAYLASQPSDIYETRQQRLVVELRSDGRAVGLIDLTAFEPLHARAEVGVALLAAERGRGHASRALALLVDYARTVLRLHQLYAYVSAGGNEASRKLFAGQGFGEVARLPEWNRRGTAYDDVLLLVKRL